MQPSTCFNCRLATRFRLRRRLIDLQNGRRRLSSTSPSEVAGSWYWDTTAPTKENLAAAAHFFKNHKPSRLWTGDEWKTSELWRASRKASSQRILVPEVVFLGRSNVGKSTLINAMNSADLNRVSGTPGMTEVMAAWGLAAKEQNGGAVKGWDGDMTPKITLVDMPGYGFGSRAEWGNQIVSYMNKRRNLRRAFLLVDSVHGIMAADRHMLEIFRKLGIPFQLVATKCDRLRTNASESDIREALETIRRQASTDNSALMLGEIIAVGALQDASGAKALREDGFGITNLQWAILKAVNLEWLAMDKAAVHKVIDKSATQRPQGKIDAELSHLVQKKSDVTDPAVPTDKATSSSQELPNLSLQDFMREILGTGSETGTSESQPSRSQPSRSHPRVFDKLRADLAEPKSYITPQQQLDSDYKELQTHITPFPEDRDNSLPARRGSPYAPPSSLAGARSAQSSHTSAKVAEGIGAFEAMFAESRNPPPRQQPPRRSAAAPSRNRAAPQQQTTPPPPGKGVSRGLDAFEALFAEPAKSQPKQRSGGRRKKGGNASQPTASQPAKEPVIIGKGVSRGLDAFESMFAEPAQTKGRKTKRRG